MIAYKIHLICTRIFFILIRFFSEQLLKDDFFQCDCNWMNEMTDLEYIRRTLELARQGCGNVSPNPMVGAVIALNDEIIGEGYHQCFGKEHAEIMALRNAGERARGATLYINLEPCCHYGKTPPCTDAIIRAGIKRVVIGMEDPNPLVCCKGIDTLIAHQIEVKTKVAEKECRLLNRAFIKYMTRKLPFFTIKIAQSIDGRIATKTGHSKWITSAAARKQVHRLRHENDAVIVGVNTVRIDNPQLTVREVPGRTPYRIVLDSHLNIPENSHLLSDDHLDKTIIATISDDEDRLNSIEARGVRVWKVQATEENQISLSDLSTKMAQYGYISALVEGGAQVFTSFLREKLADHIDFFIAPKILGSGIEAIGDLNIGMVEQSLMLNNVQSKNIGSDFLIEADIEYR